MDNKIISFKILSIATLFVLLLSSCVTNKIYTEDFNPNNPEITGKNLKTQGIDIDSVFYKGGVANPENSEILFNPEANIGNIKYLEEQDYFATFNEIEEGSFQKTKYYYNIDTNKNTFVQKALETLIETDMADNKDVKVTVNILEHKISEDIYMYQACYYQKFGIEFYYQVNGNYYYFFAESIDSLQMESSDLSKINILAYKGVYSCAKQFIKYYNSIDYSSNSDGLIAEEHPAFRDHQKAGVAGFKEKKRLENMPNLIYKKYLPPSTFRLGALSYFKSYGAVFAYTVPQNAPGKFTPSFTLKMMRPELGIGFTPMFFLNSNRQGGFIFTSIDLLVHDWHEVSYAMSMSVGVGTRADYVDLRIGGSYFSRLRGADIKDSFAIYVAFSFDLD